MRVIDEALDARDATTARWIAERTIAALRPPKVHQVNEDMPELDWPMLTIDEMDELSAGATTDRYYQLKVLTEQRRRLQSEQAAADEPGEGAR